MATIIVLDGPFHKALPSGDVIHSLFGDNNVICVSSIDSLGRVFKEAGCDIFIFNVPDYDLLTSFRRDFPKATTILTTDLPMKSYSKALKKEEDLLLDHIISLRNHGTWTAHELRVTVRKILHPEDVFGIEKYLLPGTLIHREEVTGSKDRELLNTKVMQFATTCKLGQHTSKMAFGITEELLMNTIHDAPLAAGLLHYANMPRTSPVELKKEEFGALSYGCDGRTFAVSSSDPFGALKREKLFHYLKKVLRRKDSIGLIDTKKGGAGLGFFKILYSSHGLVCNVEDGKKTEVMALIDLDEQLRDFSQMTRSIHFFYGQAS